MQDDLYYTEVPTNDPIWPYFQKLQKLVNKSLIADQRSDQTLPDLLFFHSEIDSVVQKRNLLLCQLQIIGILFANYKEDSSTNESLCNFILDNKISDLVRKVLEIYCPKRASNCYLRIIRSSC
jgi:hypothetical protein